MRWCLFPGKMCLAGLIAAAVFAGAAGPARAAGATPQLALECRGAGTQNLRITPPREPARESAAAAKTYRFDIDDHGDGTALLTMDRRKVMSCDIATPQYSEMKTLTCDHAGRFRHRAKVCGEKIDIIIGLGVGHFTIVYTLTCTDQKLRTLEWAELNLEGRCRPLATGR